MNKGFIALTMVLVITGILAVLSFGLLIDSVSFFDLVTKKEYRYINKYNAQNCIDYSLLELSHDYFFSTTTPYFIPHLNCSIISVTIQGTYRSILTRGDLGKAYVYKTALVKMNTNNLEIIN